MTHLNIVRCDNCSAERDPHKIGEWFVVSTHNTEADYCTLDCLVKAHKAHTPGDNTNASS